MLTSVFIATSLDGFIARTNGELDWLDAANEVVPEGEDCGYHAFMDKINVLVMGRKTFEKVLTFGQWSYGETPVIVLSKNKIEIPSKLTSTVSSSSETPDQLCMRLKVAGVKRIYVDGGNTIQRFLRKGLMDEITITTIPVLLGSGIRLFGELEKDISLRLVSSKTYDFGFVQTTYQIEK